MSSKIDVIIPEIIDYEVRRAFLLEGLTASIGRLDRLKDVLTYLPLTTRTMVRAAHLWADMRRHGKPTADHHALDGDVILAAQAEAVNGRVATENVGHLSLLVEARLWKDIRAQG